MKEERLTLAGLRTVVAEPRGVPALTVIVLHGFAMVPEDLTPFAASIGLKARFVFPEGPLPGTPHGRAWWEVDQEGRVRAQVTGPRDLAWEHPNGAPRARTQLQELLAAVQTRWTPSAVALVGFSQGGMLACDLVLRARPPLAALALLSACRIAADEWEALVPGIGGLRVLVSHGRQDRELSFAAGEGLRDMLIRGGAAVTWVPFDEGHEIPLPVWRRLKKFLLDVAVGR